MSNTQALRGGRFVSLFWLVVSLGSCSVVQYNITTTEAYSLASEVDRQSDCHQFQRSIRLGHTKPVVPDVDIRNVTPEQLNEVLLSLTEDLIVFIEHEELYLKEDIARHATRCQESHAR